MTDTSFMMVTQETRWGYIPPQQPVQQYPAVQQPMPQQQIIPQQYGNGNTTNIFNNYTVPSQVQQPAVSQQPVIQQPNLMIPQVPAYETQQQPAQIVFVPTNLGAAPPVATTPAPASNDSAMKLMLLMMTMLLGSLDNKAASSTDGKTADDTDGKTTGDTDTDGNGDAGSEKMTALKAAQILKDRFEKLDKADDDDDNLIAWGEIKAYAAEHEDDKELKAAIEFFKDEEFEFNLLETNRTKSEGDDDIISLDDLNSYISYRKENQGETKLRYQQEYNSLDEARKEWDLDGNGSLDANEIKSAGNALDAKFDILVIGNNHYNIRNKHDSGDKLEGSYDNDIFFATNIKGRRNLSNIIQAKNGDDIIFIADCKGEIKGGEGNDTLYYAGKELSASQIDGIKRENRHKA